MAELTMFRKVQSRCRRGSTAATRRRWTQAALAGSAAHVFLELAAGVGMPGASVVGPAPAAVAWAAGTRAVWRTAGRTGRPADRPLQVYDGLALTAVVAHYAAWPRRRTRIGLPWLIECEGMRGDLMLAYNVILLSCGGAAVMALVRENRSASAVLGLAPLLLVPVFGHVQHREYDRLVKIAEERPAWWNRRLTDQSRSLAL
jgi:hypothetical protein